MSKNYILASITHPKFKLKWVKTKYLDLCKQLLQTECITEYSFENTFSSNSTKSEDFFSSLKQISGSTSTTGDLDMEILEYLEDRNKEVDSLEKFKTIKQNFVKYNTTIPSSAPVERLFSTAVQIFTPRRNRLSDLLFSKLLFLKGNSKE